MRQGKRVLGIAGMAIVAGTVTLLALASEARVGQLGDRPAIESQPSSLAEFSEETPIPGEAARKEETDAEKSIPAATSQMLRALENESERVRLAAISALGRMGSDAEAAVPVFEKLLRDPSRRVRLRTGRALEEFRRR